VVIGRRRVVPIVAGLAAPAVVGGCALATALAYRGTAGEPYSPLNHWISELGEVGVSRLAPVFNAGVVVGGTCLGVFMWSLASARRGRLARAYGRIGVVAGVAGALVGVFPMNRIVPHAITSTTFFNLATLAVALASVDFAVRPDARFGRAQAGVGAATAVAFAAFALVAAAAIQELGIAALEAPAIRYDVMPIMTLEWATLLGVMAWVLATALAWAGTPR
jgi:hypothetical membrane protein